MEDINNNICKRFQAFRIIFVYNANYVKFCKLLSIFNNLNILKKSVPSYRENLQDAQKIWIKFSQLSVELEQDKKKTQAQGIDF
jgi:hypothetical protein